MLELLRKHLQHILSCNYKLQSSIQRKLTPCFVYISTSLIPKCKYFLCYNIIIYDTWRVREYIYYVTHLFLFFSEMTHQNVAPCMQHVMCIYICMHIYYEALWSEIENLVTYFNQVLQLNFAWKKQHTFLFDDISRYMYQYFCTYLYTSVFRFELVLFSISIFSTAFLESHLSRLS